MFLFSIATADSASMGKIDKHMLSDQTLMELFIANIHPEDKSQFQDDDSEYSDCSQWTCVTLNDSGSIERIDMSEKTIRPGSLDFRWIPSTVKSVNAY